MHEKIKSLEEIEKTLQNHKKNREIIVQCHGVFDLLHPGHIRHFKMAKAKGDKLIVSLTPDKFVNKGPGRPAFNQNLRLESIAALSFVDYVVLNDSPDALSAIKHVKPDFYVKGKEYKDYSKDVTGKIEAEIEAVEKGGGKVFFTDDIVFSSSSLINKYIEPQSEEVKNFLKILKDQYSCNDIIKKIDALKDLKVLVIGDAIIDEYQYVDLLGQSAKGQHFVASLNEKELFLGGSLIIANHIASFTDNITLLTAIGSDEISKKLINKKLNNNVLLETINLENIQTLLKKRYILKDGKNLTKLFETYSSNIDLLKQDNADKIIDFLKHNSDKFDLVLVCDFGNGFMNKSIINELSKVNAFLAINTQINSGNRGYNVITHYKKADYISLNEPEIRLAAHDRKTLLEKITLKISDKINCPDICVTRGIKGVYCFSKNEKEQNIPAFISNTIDRVGAGDSFLALSSLCKAKKYSLLLSGFIGSIAAALNVQVVGNKEYVRKETLNKFIIRLLK
ncbi:MAG: Bifunctional protein HldE [Candidatus Anoxychlamydiales bacterium]|nr:Bifunctional protein HldE [Candidatus Anoxychlamydiales bacterium]